MSAVATVRLNLAVVLVFGLTCAACALMGSVPLHSNASTAPSTPALMSAVIPVQRDESLHATVHTCSPLYYAAGADKGEDRPAHVRAGSGLAWWNGRLTLVQDDARFIALVDPGTLRVDALALPRGEDGARVFGEDRGTKHLKLDLEAVVSLPGGGLLTLGSGSSPRREHVALVRSGEAPVLIDAQALYAVLRQTEAFAGSELNVEGALVVPHRDGGAYRLRLVNRGNGAPRAGRQPVNATADLDLDALIAYLAAPDAEPPPPLLDVSAYGFGMLDGLRLGFTDAALMPSGRLLVTMAAEDSPDATRDGRVAGSALGIVDEEGQRPLRLRWTALRWADGTPFAGKVEGLAPDSAAPRRVYLVADDDSARPSTLCVAELAGPW